MRHPHTLTASIPEGVHCTIENSVLSCSQNGVTLTRRMNIANGEVTIEGRTITIHAPRANKRIVSAIISHKAHIMNLFKGLEKPFEYKLQICHVHFPMTCKVDGQRVIITNFLGEKKARHSSIVPSVTVTIKGQDVTVTGHDIEKAGQTAANLEIATRVPSKDRRVFQDGIFITHKPRGAL